MARNQLFIPITKVDVETRTVFGQMTAEKADSANEIWDYDGSKPYFERWSANQAEKSGGKSMGNVRSMHQPIAAGKLTQFVMDDAAKTVEIAAKVVDDTEWGKVLEGVYTGFSQGGRYIKRWKDPTDSTKTRYISDPVEVSLVDIPCLTTATFEMVKADGVEQRPFRPWAPTNDDIFAKAKALSEDDAHKGRSIPDLMDVARDALEAEHTAEVAKKLDAEDDTLPAIDDTAPADLGKILGDDPVVASEDVEKTAAVEEPTDWAVTQRQVWLAKDGSEHEKKADAIAKNDQLRAAVEEGTPLAAAIAKAKAAVAAALGTEAAPAEAADKAALIEQCTALVATVGEMEAAEKALRQLPEAEVEGGLVAKRNLYSVSRLADILMSLKGTITGGDYYYDPAGGGAPEDTKVTGQLVSGFKTLGDALVTMAREEVAAAVAQMTRTGGAKVSAKADQPELAKLLEGVAADEPLVAKVAGMLDALPPSEGDAALKALTAENAALKGQIDAAVPQITELGETVAKLGVQLKETQAQVEKMAKEPAPMPIVVAGTGVVDKVGSTEPVKPEQAQAMLAKMVDDLGLETVRQAVFKSIMQNGVQVSTPAPA